MSNTQGAAIYRIQTFYPLQAPKLAQHYHQQHIKALRDFRVNQISSANTKWWHQPNVYAIVISNQKQQIVAGSRVEIIHPNYPLPLESAIQKESPDIIQDIHQYQGQLAEFCGAWISPSARKKGLCKQLVQTSLELSQELGLKRVMSFPSQHTQPIFEQLGFEAVYNTHKQSTYIYPDERYQSTLMGKSIS